MYLVKDMMAFALLLAVIIAIVFGGIFTIVTGSNYYQCKGFQTVTGLQTRFEGLNCYVQVGDTYQPWEQYKKAFETNANLNVKVK